MQRNASMVAKNLKGKNLLTSPVSFVSTANSSIFTGGNTIFCDVDPLTANLSISEIKKIIKHACGVAASTISTGFYRASGVGMGMGTPPLHTVLPVAR